MERGRRRFRIGASVLGVALRGLLSRRLLTLGTLLLAVVSIGSAVLGPVYLTPAVTSLIQTRLDAEEPAALGLSWRYDPAEEMSIAQAMTSAARVGEERAAAAYDDPVTTVQTERLDVAVDGPPRRIRLVAPPDECGSFQVTGRCPSGPNEIAVAQVDVARGDYRIGSLAQGPNGSKLRVVGSYRLRDDSAQAYLPARYTSVPYQPPNLTSAEVPYTPAPFLTRSATIAEQAASDWYVQIDRSFTPPATLTPGDLNLLAANAERERTRAPVRMDGATLRPADTSALGRIAATVADEKDTAQRTVLPAAFSLTVIALLLLLRLSGESAAARRSELALLSLRGWSRRRLWAYALGEPLLVLAVAIPLGVTAGWLGGIALAHWWLRPGVEVALTTGAWWSVAAVTVAALAASAAAFVGVLRAHLSSQLGGAIRAPSAGRVAVVSRIVVLIMGGAIAIFASLDGGTPAAIDLAVPVVLALGTGLLASYATLWFARLWCRYRPGAAVGGYVAVRRLARRREGALVVLPLTAALGVAVFAGSVTSAASAWRDSAAAAQVTADVSYDSRFGALPTLDAVRDADPNGRWLMAAAVFNNANDARVVALDTQRLPRVGVWPDTWWRDAKAVQSALHGDDPSAPVPLLATDDIELNRTILTGSSVGDAVAARLIGIVNAVPIAGRSGVLVDLETYTDAEENAAPAFARAYVLARDDTPSEVLTALADRGIDIESPQQRSQVRALLDDDAYALSLRLYGVVAVLLFALAIIALTVHLIVGLRERRRDTASLRVVGVRRRTVAYAAMIELGVVLGAAALAGIVSGLVASRLVVTRLELGPDDAAYPDVPVVFDIAGLLGISVGTAAVLLAVAIGVAQASVRRAQTSSLREPND